MDSRLTAERFHQRKLQGNGIRDYLRYSSRERWPVHASTEAPLFGAYLGNRTRYLVLTKDVHSRMCLEGLLAEALERPECTRPDQYTLTPAWLQSPHCCLPEFGRSRWNRTTALHRMKVLP